MIRCCLLCRPTNQATWFAINFQINNSISEITRLHPKIQILYMCMCVSANRKRFIHIWLFLLLQKNIRKNSNQLNEEGALYRVWRVFYDAIQCKYRIGEDPHVHIWHTIIKFAHRLWMCIVCSFIVDFKHTTHSGLYVLRSTLFFPSFSSLAVFSSLFSPSFLLCPPILFYRSIHNLILHNPVELLVSPLLARSRLGINHKRHTLKPPLEQ